MTNFIVAIAGLYVALVVAGFIGRALGRRRERLRARSRGRTVEQQRTVDKEQELKLGRTLAILDEIEPVSQEEFTAPSAAPHRFSPRRGG